MKHKAIKGNSEGRNFNLNKSSKRKGNYGSSDFSSGGHESNLIAQSLLTSNGGYSMFEAASHNSNSSNSQSLRMLMNSTTSSSNTLFLQASQEIKNSQKLRQRHHPSTLSVKQINAGSPTTTTRSKANDYNETFGCNLNNIMKENRREAVKRKHKKFKDLNPSVVKINNVLRNSMSQRRKFVHEIEGRLKGLKGLKGEK